MLIVDIGSWVLDEASTAREWHFTRIYMVSGGKSVRPRLKQPGRREPLRGLADTVSVPICDSGNHRNHGDEQADESVAILTD